MNIFNTTTTNSPKADGLNAMQSWVICCIFFVFGALFEYAIILLQMKIKTFRKLAASMQKDETCAMDVAVLIAFPVVFLIFNIVYWAAFHLWEKKQMKKIQGVQFENWFLLENEFEFYLGIEETNVLFEYLVLWFQSDRVLAKSDQN